MAEIAIHIRIAFLVGIAAGVLAKSFGGAFVIIIVVGKNSKITIRIGGAIGSTKRVGRAKVVAAVIS